MLYDEFMYIIEMVLWKDCLFSLIQNGHVLTCVKHKWSIYPVWPKAPDHHANMSLLEIPFQNHDHNIALPPFAAITAFTLLWRFSSRILSVCLWESVQKSICELRHWCCMRRAGLQSALIPKLFSGFEVRALWRPLVFLHAPNLSPYILVDLAQWHSPAGTVKGLPQNCCHKVGRIQFSKISLYAVVYITLVM